MRTMTNIIKVFPLTCAASDLDMLSEKSLPYGLRRVADLSAMEVEGSCN
jgi:hypothetical protein